MRERPEFTEPSGVVVSNAERADNHFSDISRMGGGEYFFISRGMRYGQWFAIKGVNPAYRDNEALCALLRKEFDLLIGLQHPNVRRALGWEEVADLGRCIVLEYIEGETLGQWLAAKPALSSRIRVASEIADALEYIHRQGIVHRDIKPDNILITHIGETVRLIDFGLSDSDGFAIWKGPAGTDSYMSPEQAAESLPEVSNDVYSLGVLLKKLLPEPRFAKLINSCTGEANQRPRSVAEVKEKILKKRRISPAYLWITVAVIIAVASGLLAGVFFQDSETPSVTESQDDTFPKETVVEDLPGVQQETVHPVAVGENPSDAVAPQTAANPSPVVRMKKAEAFEVFYREGSHMLRIALDEIKKKSAEQGAPAAFQDEAAELMQKIKDGYISSLDYQMNHSESFSETYDFDGADLKKLSESLDEEVGKLTSDSGLY